MKRSILTTVSILLAACAAAQPRFETQVTTHLFGERDGKHLMLDRYTSPATEGIRPCMIFVFGGGFTSGEQIGRAHV